MKTSTQTPSKRRNRVVTTICAVAVVIMAVVITISSASYDEDTPRLYLHDGPVIAEEITLWINGGKNNMPMGISVDSKTKNLVLYERYDGKYYDVTGAKTVKWIALPVNEKDEFTVPTDFKAAKSEVCAVNVSKGKVSAKDGGRAAVIALKSNSKGEIVGYEYCIFEVLVAPQKIDFVDENNNIVKALTIGVGDTAELYLSPSAKTEVDNSESYILSFEKDGGDYLSFERGDQTFEVTQSRIERTPIEINADAMNAGKLTKATILVKAANGGKTSKLTVTIGNTVYETPTKYDRLDMKYSDKEPTVETIKGTDIKQQIVTSAEYFGIKDFASIEVTDKPKIFVTTAEPTADNMIDSKGALNYTGEKFTDLSAKLDKDNNLTLTLKKAVATTSDRTVYVVIGYNSRVDKRDNLRGCIIYEVDIEGVRIRN